jgi:hypothetical protein
MVFFFLTFYSNILYIENINSPGLLYLIVCGYLKSFFFVNVWRLMEIWFRPKCLVPALSNAKPDSSFRRLSGDIEN